MIRVGTLNTTSTYYYDRDDQVVGFEHDLIWAFFKEQKKSPRFVVKNSLSELLTALENGRIDIAAAGLSLTPSREKKFLASTSFMEVRPYLMCRPHLRPSSIDRLKSLRLAVLKDSSFEESLKKNDPALEYDSLDEISTLALTEKIYQRQYDCTVLDDHLIRLNRRLFPRVEKVMPMQESEQWVWYFHPTQQKWHLKANKWLESKEGKAAVKNLKEYYFGFIDEHDPFDIEVFQRRINSRLKPLMGYFKKAAHKYDLDWTLLAALAYQESNWSASAISPTGVRGVMMLTLRTAQSLGVEDRLDPEQSIMGGAKYLAQIKDRLPEEISGENRTWMALAAYNVGFSHLRNARTLATQKEMDPNLWANVRETLPLLSQRQYYQQFSNGRARGREPVILVSRVRHYQNLLHLYL